MADISKIQVPGSATQYNIKDAQARRDIEDVKADLGSQVGVFSKTEGYYINLTTDPVSLTPQTTATAGMAFSIIECVSGDKFVINAVGGNSGRAWGFLDSSNHVLSMADANATVEGLELTAPATAVKLIINDKSGGISYKVGNNIVSRVTALETAEPELSEDVKTALLNLVSHIGVWTDEKGQEYVDDLEAALSGYPTIKVFMGKGTSGASFIDNAKRAITEPIPFINTAPITVQRTVSGEDDGYVYSAKIMDGDGLPWVAPSGNTYGFRPSDRFDWMALTGIKTWTDKVSDGSGGYTYPEVSFAGNTNNTLRILFASYEGLSSDMPSTPPQGYVIIQGRKYKLEVSDNEEFI